MLTLPSKQLNTLTKSTWSYPFVDVNVQNDEEQADVGFVQALVLVFHQRNRQQAVDDVLGRLDQHHAGRLVLLFLVICIKKIVLFNYTQVYFSNTFFWLIKLIWSFYNLLKMTTLIIFFFFNWSYFLCILLYFKNGAQPLGITT